MEEEELEVQLSKAFPGGTFTCALCEELCGSDYQMKEHVMLNHPWNSLEALVEKSEKEGNKKIHCLPFDPVSQVARRSRIIKTLERMWLFPSFCFKVSSNTLQNDVLSWLLWLKGSLFCLF